MGMTMAAVKKLARHGFFKPKGRVLDVGSTNLYSATEKEVLGFIAAYNPAITAATRALAKRLADGSRKVPGLGPLNQSFLGQMLEAAGMTYISFDIYEGYKTLLIDLNKAALPALHHKAFDTVINSGTTEHILNQINCFKVIHDAVDLGGQIFHALPSVGFIDHCYFTYTGRFFFDLAGYNQYDIVEFWMDMGPELSSVLKSVEAYALVFPALKAFLKREAAQGASVLNLFRCPDVSINMILRKVKDLPFMGMLETSTTAGIVPLDVKQAYANYQDGFTLPGRPRQGANDNLQSANANLQNANGNLQNANDNLQNANDSLRNANDNLRNANDNLQNANGNLQRECDDLRREYDDLRREYDDLRRERDDLRRERDDLRREREEEVKCFQAELQRERAALQANL